VKKRDFLNKESTEKVKGVDQEGIKRGCPPLKDFIAS